MQVLERDLERRCVAWAQDQGILALKLTPMGKKGYPDRLFLIGEGRVVFVEFKREGEEATPLQEYRMKALRAMGYGVLLADDEASFRKRMGRILRG